MSSLMSDPEVKAEIERIRALPDIAEPAALEAPQLDTSPSPTRTGVVENIRRIQAFIRSFQYNYSGKPFIRMNKSKGALHVFAVSRQLIKEQLPMQCVEAVFLGAHLTASMQDVERVSEECNCVCVCVCVISLARDLAYTPL